MSCWSTVMNEQDFKIFPCTRYNEEQITIDACTYPWLTAASLVQNSLTGFEPTTSSPCKRNVKEVLQEWLQFNIKRFSLPCQISLTLLLQTTWKQRFLNYLTNEFLKKKKYSDKKEATVCYNKTKVKSLEKDDDDDNNNNNNDDDDEWMDIPIISESQPVEAYETIPSLYKIHSVNETLLETCHWNTLEPTHKLLDSLSTALPKEADSKHSFDDEKKTGEIQHTVLLPNKQAAKKSLFSLVSSCLSRRCITDDSFDGTIISEDVEQFSKKTPVKRFSLLKKKKSPSFTTIKQNNSSYYNSSKPSESMESLPSYPHKIYLHPYCEQFDVVTLLKKPEISLFHDISLYNLQAAYGSLQFRVNTSFEKKTSWAVQLYQLLTSFPKETSTDLTVIRNILVDANILQESCSLLTKDFCFIKEKESFQVKEEKLSLMFSCLLLLQELFYDTAIISTFFKTMTLSFFYDILYNIESFSSHSPLLIKLKQGVINALCRMILLIKKNVPSSLQPPWDHQIIQQLNGFLTSDSIKNYDQERIHLNLIIAAICSLTSCETSLDSLHTINIPFLFHLLHWEMSNKWVVTNVLQLVYYLIINDLSNIRDQLAAVHHINAWDTIVTCCLAYHDDTHICFHGIHILNKIVSMDPSRTCFKLQTLPNFVYLLSSFLDASDTFLNQLGGTLRCFNQFLQDSYFSDTTIMSLEKQETYRQTFALPIIEP